MKSKKSFSAKCYSKLKEVPAGKVTTYKDLAWAINSKAYLAIGTAMNKNPFAPKVPCHRVVNFDGKIGEFSSGAKNKIKILEKEGIKIKNGKVQDFKKVLHKF